jgi:hypothetical protein
MENIAISLIVDGSMKNMIMPKNMLGELAVKLREEGKYMVHTSKESYEAEGFVVLAKGTKNGVMLLPNLND